MQHIHILGTGAMACLWGSYFSNTQTLHFISRQNHNSSFEYNVRPHNQVVQGQLESKDSVKKIDILIVATKAFDALSAVQSVAHAFTDTTEILVLQNGMGSQQAIATEFGHLPIYACSSTEGAYKASERELVHAGKGINTVGALTDFATESRLSNWLPIKGYKWSNDIEPILWKKLLVNCAINPLTVIYQCQNGQLLENQSALEHMRLLCEEMDALLQINKMLIGNSFELAQSVCKQTAKNFSSMYQDAKHGRQTEIDYITGYMIQQCHQHHSPCPTHKWVYEKIRNHHLGDPSDLG